LNALDKPFAGRYHPGWTTAGTVTATAVLVASPLVLAAFEGPAHAANDTAVLAESALIASAVGVIFEIGARRPRPYLYGDAAPLAERTATNASLSFFSGHTALAFAATIATWRTLGKLDVAPRWQWLALGVGLAGSAFVGASRVVSGDHFPSDVLVGAGVGVAAGFLLPGLHTHRVAVAPQLTADRWLLSAAGRF
jgi:membrane-associated phospholipid phosphatase